MHPSAVLARISLAKNRMETPEELLEAGTSARDQLVGSVWQRYQEFLARTRALDFDDLLLATVRLLREHEGRPRALPQALPPRPRGRVPGHEPPPVRDRPRDRGRAPERLRGGRRRPVDLRLARGRHPQDPRLPPRLPRGEGRAPADELPLDPPHPRGGQRRHPPQRLPPREGPRVGAGRRRARALRAPQGRDGGGAARGPRDPPAPAARGGAARGLRHPLPHAGAVPPVRGGAAGERHPLRRGGRDVLLRPQGGPRRRRLPEAGREPARRDVAPAGRQHAPARRGQGEPRQGARLRHPPRHRGERGVRAGGRDRGARARGGRGLPRAARGDRRLRARRRRPRPRLPAAGASSTRSATARRSAVSTPTR